MEFVLAELLIVDLLVSLVANLNIFLPAGFFSTGVTLGVVLSLVDMVVHSGTVGVGCVICMVFLSCKFVCFAFANSFNMVTKHDCSTAEEALIICVTVTWRTKKLYVLIWP